VEHVEKGEFRLQLPARLTFQSITATSHYRQPPIMN